MDELSDEENDLLAEMAEMQSEQGVKKVVEIIATLRPCMLHCYCVDIQQMDDLTPLFAVLESPQCDRGTATLIYWLSDPHQFAGKESVMDYEVQQFELYKKAEAMLLTNAFARRKIRFNPVKDAWYDKHYWQAVRKNSFIPKKLKPKIAVDDLRSEWSLFRKLEIALGEKCRNTECIDDRVKLGVFCRKHHFEMIFKQMPPEIESSELRDEKHD